MTALQLAHVLQTVVVLGGTALVFFWLIPTLRLDVYRQKLFVLRDQLFDYALSGEISFDDPAYRLLRDHMNGLIRYGHHLSIFRVSLSMLISSVTNIEPRKSWHDSWSAALAQVPSECARKRLIRFHEDAVTHAAKHLILGSPVLLAIVAVAMIGSGLSHATQASLHGLRQLAAKTSKRVLRRPLDYLEDEALCA